MININGYAGNPNFRINSTIDINKNHKKQNALQNIIIPSSAVGAGAIAGGIYSKKKYTKTLDKLWDNLRITINDLNKFAAKTEEANQGRYCSSPLKTYYKMIDYFEKMNQVKDKPRIENANCLAFISKDEEKAKEAIDWFAKASKQKYSCVDLWEDGFDLVDFLEKAEENYQKTKEWNLIYAKNMDKLINPDEVEPAVIAAMKDIMCSTADEFHSTLLFFAKDTSKLDDIAIETNRVNEFFNVDELKHFDEFKKLCNKYNQQCDLIEHFEKSKNLFTAKNIGIGALVGAGVVVAGVFIKKIIDKTIKRAKNES